MDKTKAERLAKVLALLDSSESGEAGAAMRLARQMLAKEGLSLADLARQAANQSVPGRTNPAHLQTLGLSQHQLEERLHALQREYEALQDISLHQEEEVRSWREQVKRLRDTIAKSREQIAFWKGVAEDTANTLWNLGREVQTMPEKPAGKSASRFAARFKSRKPLTDRRLDQWQEWLDATLDAESKIPETPDKN